MQASYHPPISSTSIEHVWPGMSFGLIATIRFSVYVKVNSVDEAFQSHIQIETDLLMLPPLSLRPFWVLSSSWVRIHTVYCSIGVSVNSRKHSKFEWSHHFKHTQSFAGSRMFWVSVTQSTVLFIFYQVLFQLLQGYYLRSSTQVFPPKLHYILIIHGLLGSLWQGYLLMELYL